MRDQRGPHPSTAAQWGNERRARLHSSSKLSSAVRRPRPPCSRDPSLRPAGERRRLSGARRPSAPAFLRAGQPKPSAAAALGARNCTATGRQHLRRRSGVPHRSRHSLRRAALRDRLHAAGIETFEADVRFATRYLIERGIKGRLRNRRRAAAAADTATAITWVFDNPCLRPAEVTVEPRVLSFDIETDPKCERLLAISLFAPGIDEVLIVDGSGRPCRSAPSRCSDRARRAGCFLRARAPRSIRT